MSQDKWRDDSFLNRLHSFLAIKGGLDPEQIIPIKKNVYKINFGNQWFVVKCYRKHLMTELWSFFNQIEDTQNLVTFIPFPNGEKWLKDANGQYWCLAPFIEGERLSYKQHHDRQSAVQRLQSFHNQTQEKPITLSKQKSFLKKLIDRYKRFKKTNKIFVQYDSIMFYQQMIKHTDQLLDRIKQLNWDKIEQEARQKQSIIHGDSAAHNFIKNENGIYLIDFDLIQYAPVEYEWVQLAQRFLFEGLDQYEELFTYEVFDKYKDNPYFYFGTIFPSDLFREWLHFLRRNPTNQEIHHYLQNMKHNWNKRQKICDKSSKYDTMNYISLKEENLSMKKQIEQLTNWLQQQVEEAGLNGLVVGISGGIDSAVVAHLIQRAFPDDSLGIILPCKSNPDDQKYAQMVVESSGIKSHTIDLTESHNVLFPTIKNELQKANDWDEQQEKLADANLRARLRMSTLYTVATNYRYLVTGTDNAAEWFTGYFTKFGDGGVDLVPLLHYTKGEVRELAKELGVPDEIINKPPSAGLWEGQTDENEMGTTYDRIDQYLRGEEVPEQDKQVIEQMHAKTAHKRELPKSPPEFK